MCSFWSEELLTTSPPSAMILSFTESYCKIMVKGMKNPDKAFKSVQEWLQNISSYS